MKRNLNCLVKSQVVEVKVACLGQSQSSMSRSKSKLSSCHMWHACLVACMTVHAKVVRMHVESRVSCN
jgi:hypothetical protein